MVVRVFFYFLNAMFQSTFLSESFFLPLILSFFHQDGLRSSLAFPCSYSSIQIFFTCSNLASRSPCIIPVNTCRFFHLLNTRSLVCCLYMQWAPCHSVVATPLLLAFEMLLCIYLHTRSGTNHHNPMHLPPQSMGLVSSTESSCSSRKSSSQFKDCFHTTCFV